MRDYIIIRHESFQARVLLSELHLLDVLHFRRLIKLAERDPWQNGPELDTLREALPELADRAAAEFTAAEAAVKNYRRAHRGDHSPGRGGPGGPPEVCGHSGQNKSPPIPEIP